jgi:hypothetical protein
MFNTIVGAGAIGAGAGSGFDQKMLLLAAPAPQHCEKQEQGRGCFAFGEWSFEKWSHSENGRILAVPRIGRLENGRSEIGIELN